MPWKATPPDIDWTAPADAPGGRRWLRAVGWVALGVIVTAPFVAFDAVHPRDRILSRGRVWHCELVGGSWPVAAGLEVGLRPGARMVRFGAVDADQMWIAVVRVEEGFDHSTEAAFVLGDRAGERLGGLDGRGRDLAAKRSTASANSYRAAIVAARECLHRHLPDRS